MLGAIVVLFMRYQLVMSCVPSALCTLLSYYTSIVVAVCKTSVTPTTEYMDTLLTFYTHLLKDVIPVIMNVPLWLSCTTCCTVDLDA